MTVDAAPRTRRNFLTMMAAAASGVVAATMAGAQRALAAGSDGTPIVVGGSYFDARTMTRIINVSNNESVLGASTGGAGTALDGYSRDGEGVYARTHSGIAVRALSLIPGAFAVYAVAEATTGPTFTIYSEAYSPGGGAVLGNNYATSGNAQGIQGTTDSPKGFATTGWARAGGAGVVGFSGATFPTIPADTGVYGNAPNGRGGVFTGSRAQVRLVPSSATTHPSSGQAGDLFLDKSKRLWFCKGGTTWKQLA